MTLDDDHSATDLDDVRTLPEPKRLPDDAGASAGKLDALISSSVYGSFWIADTEFALPVSVLQEVVNEPPEYAPVPLAPPHMVGLFQLRELIVPVIDLRILLGFPKAPESLKRKVAIIENGELCLGLIFDDTGGVINSSDATRVAFSPNAEGVRDVVVEGVLKLENGKRIVQILNPYEILKIEQLPRVKKTRETEKNVGELGHRLNCITLQLGHTFCAIDLRYVQEITDVPEIQTSQVAYGYILGNIDLRGRTMPIIDFRGLIGREAPPEPGVDTLKYGKLLIMSLPEGYVALLVYSIDSIMTFYDGDILPFANVALPRQDLVRGCLVNKDKNIVILLDHQKLKADPLLIEAAQSCREIYPSAATEAEDRGEGEPQSRVTYILFTIQRQMAFEISHVSEIISRPDRLLEPPYALDFVDGILNLRGTLITLINPRVLYDLPDKDARGSKVVIFQRDQKKYGIVVDSVDEIVTASNRELLDVPSISESGSERIVSQDVLGCLRVPSRPVESNPVLVLDVAALVSRCVALEG